MFARSRVTYVTWLSQISFPRCVRARVYARETEHDIIATIDVAPTKYPPLMISCTTLIDTLVDIMFGGKIKGYRQAQTTNSNTRTITPERQLRSRLLVNR